MAYHDNGSDPVSALTRFDQWSKILVGISAVLFPLIQRIYSMYRFNAGEIRDIEQLAQAIDVIESHYGITTRIRFKPSRTSDKKWNIGLETTPLDDPSDVFRTTVVWSTYRSNKAFISVNDYATLLSQVEEHLAFCPHFCGEGSEGASLGLGKPKE